MPETDTPNTPESAKLAAVMHHIAQHPLFAAHTHEEATGLLVGTAMALASMRMGSMGLEAEWDVVKVAAAKALTAIDGVICDAVAGRS